MTAAQFKKKHPDLVKAAEANGVDWAKLLETLGPLLVLILSLLKKK